MCGSNKQERKHNKNKVRKSKSTTPSILSLLYTGSRQSSKKLRFSHWLSLVWHILIAGLFEFEKRWLSRSQWKSMIRWSLKASHARKTWRNKWTTISEATTWTDWVSRTREATAAAHLIITLWPVGKRRVPRVAPRTIGSPTYPLIHISLTHHECRTKTSWSLKMYLLLGKPAERPYSSIKTSKRRTMKPKISKCAASPPTSRGTSEARPWITRSIRIQSDSLCPWMWVIKLTQTRN